MMSNFKYLEKKLPISVKCPLNGDFTRHIANFESVLDSAPVFGPIKSFNSLNVFRKTKKTPITVSPAENAVKMPFCNFGSIYARAPVFGPIDFFCIVNLKKKKKKSHNGISVLAVLQFWLYLC